MRPLLSRSLLLLLLSCPFWCMAQTTLTLQPGPDDGKDAIFHGLVTEANVNWGNDIEFCASAWTYQGVPGTIRSGIEFDLAAIPAGTTVISASLSLYAYGSSIGQGPHSTLNGSNASWLERITSPWDEQTSTWNTQPSSTALHRVALPMVPDPQGDLVGIDVTALVQDMVNDPAGSHGFLMRLQTEQYYRRMNFCSSDNANAERRPKLVVTYATAPSEECTAQAAHMVTDIGPVCLVGGEAVLSAVPAGTPTVPPGHVTSYLLSRTNGLILEQLSATPEFTVNSVDIWRIHQFVYDPSTIDPAWLEPGTYLYDLQEQLLQGGGAICASLDISGAPVKTGECNGGCEAHASAMATDIGPVCLVEGEATLSAVATGTAMVPPDHTIAYLLSRTNGLILEQLSATPEFTVNSVDIWRIHQFVYDPATIDPAWLEPGTYLYDLQEHLVQGGGTICAGLDISGAPVKTGICDEQPCPTAGTDGSVALCTGESAIPLFTLLDGDPDQGGTWLGPQGFPLGGTIVPSTSAEGTYLYIVNGIAPCVSDTARLTITFNSAPNAGLNAFLTICSDEGPFALADHLAGSPAPGGTWAFGGAPHSPVYSPGQDMSGPYVYTVLGSAPCADAQATLYVSEQEAADAGTDAVVTVAFTAAPFTLFSQLGGTPQQDGSWSAPDGQQVDAVFIPGQSPAGVYVYTVPGQAPCLSDAATVTVIMEEQQELQFFPSLTTGITQVALPLLPSIGVRVELFDALGRPGNAPATFTAQGLTVDASVLPFGAWTVRITGQGRMWTGRFVHVTE